MVVMGKVEEHEKDGEIRHPCGRLVTLYRLKNLSRKWADSCSACRDRIGCADCVVSTMIIA